MRIVRKKSNVFIREDFADLGDYDQVGRALLRLIRRNKLIKLGYGIYAKTKLSQLTGEIIPVAPLPVLAKEALKRLGVKTSPTLAELVIKALQFIMNVLKDKAILEEAAIFY